MRHPRYAALLLVLVIPLNHQRRPEVTLLSTLRSGLWISMRVSPAPNVPLLSYWVPPAPELLFLFLLG